VNTANRCDLDPLAADLTRLAVSIQQEQLAFAQERAKAFAELGEGAD
jgi:hypothetical protein